MNLCPVVPLFFLPSAAVYSTQVSPAATPGAADAILLTAPSSCWDWENICATSRHPDHLNGLTASTLIDRHPLGWPRDPASQGRPR